MRLNAQRPSMPVAVLSGADEWGAAMGSHGDEVINRIAPRLPRAYQCPDYHDPEAGGSDVA